MSESYVCADCNEEFDLHSEEGDPRCPSCGRTEAVEPADTSALQSDIYRQWLVVFALLTLAGLAYLLWGHEAP